MKTTAFVLALMFALAVAGCSKSGNDPVSPFNGLSGVASKSSTGVDDNGSDRGGAKRDRVEGRIVAIDLAQSTVTIRTQAGEDVPALADSRTKIERNGFHATLSSFKVGDRGQAMFSPGTSRASKLEATGL